MILETITMPFKQFRVGQPVSWNVAMVLKTTGGWQGSSNVAIEHSDDFSRQMHGKCAR